MNEVIDFVAIARRYAELGNGAKAELRRAGKPDDLVLIPAFYHLLPGIRTDKRWQRVVFFLPYITHAENGATLGKQLAGKVSEERLFQVLRSTSPNDLIQLRRLVKQVDPVLDWQKFGAMLFYWNERAKRRLIEDYFLPPVDSKKEAVS